MSEPSFSLGIEEEYLLVDVETYDLAAAPEALMSECAEKAGGQVSPEFLQCQIEVGTAVCKSIGEARSELVRLRTMVRDTAAKYGLAPIAVSTHPFAEWNKQHFTDKQRYRELEKDLAGVARRMLICGMHVHVGIDDDDLRIDMLRQFPYFLPHLLALSTSSPFWEGRDTGLSSYRLTVFDNLPRTGLPPDFNSWREYQRALKVLTENHVIEDTTKIWWDVRPSARFPTLESRICDVMPNLEDSLTIAALTQCLMRMLYRLRCNNQRWRVYDNFLIGENRWRAQRYGTAEGLIDFGQQKIVPYGDLLDELLRLLAEDAEALDCVDEVHNARDILKRGTSAERQRAVYTETLEKTGNENKALKEVVRLLVEEFAPVSQ
ncbi:MAG: carboxylate-amine ligase [Rhizobiaceae bacterium]